MPNRKAVRLSLIPAALLLAGLAGAPSAPAGEAGTPASEPPFQVLAATRLGVADASDAVVGARFQADGTLVLAVNGGPGFRRRVKAPALARGTPKVDGCILRVSADGRKALNCESVAAEIHDLALDGNDCLYIAAGRDGLLKLDPQASRVLWRQPLADCQRVDAAGDGHCVALAGGQVSIFDPSGRRLDPASHRETTCDVCLDGASRTVIRCGYRAEPAGVPAGARTVDICFLEGLDYEGRPKWSDYDGPPDRDWARFLDQTKVSDTRAGRCAIGRDGKLYVAFQVQDEHHAGRWRPGRRGAPGQGIRPAKADGLKEPVRMVGGDACHQFFGSEPGPKAFFARYDPATGDCELGQQFCGRRADGQAGAVFVDQGEIHADAEGRVFLAGSAEAGLPLNPGGGAKDTGGDFLLVMAPDFQERLGCLRLAAERGTARAVDTRLTPGSLKTVYGGQGLPAGLLVKNPAPPATGLVKTGRPADDAFFALLEKPIKTPSLPVPVTVDPRIELVSIIFHLAGSPEYNASEVTNYVAAIDRYFQPYANHPAVELARQLRNGRGIAFDAPMSLAIRIRDVPSLAGRVPWDPPPAGLDPRWVGEDILAFTAAARAFVKDADFEKFFAAQQPLYDQAVRNAQTLLARETRWEWFSQFFGSNAKARLNVVLALVNGPGNYGPSFQSGGQEEFYSILGVWRVTEEGQPLFDQTVLPILVHEFCHSYVNPLGQQYAAELEEPGRKWFARVEARMRSQAYGHWLTMINESVVRASVIRYQAAAQSSFATAFYINSEVKNGFLWTEGLVNLLGEYEQQRQRYPNLAAFYPRIIDFFKTWQGP